MQSPSTSSILDVHGKYEGRLKFRGLAAVRRCYAEGGGDCYAKF
jgi:hypothetical protein